MMLMLRKPRTGCADILTSARPLLYAHVLAEPYRPRCTSKTCLRTEPQSVRIFRTTCTLSRGHTARGGMQAAHVARRNTHAGFGRQPSVSGRRRRSPTHFDDDDCREKGRVPLAETRTCAHTLDSPPRRQRALSAHPAGAAGRRDPVLGIRLRISP